MKTIIMKLRWSICAIFGYFFSFTAVVNQTKLKLRMSRLYKFQVQIKFFNSQKRESIQVCKHKIAKYVDEKHTIKIVTQKPSLIYRYVFNHWNSSLFFLDCIMKQNIAIPNQTTFAGKKQRYQSRPRFEGSFHILKANFLIRCEKKSALNRLICTKIACLLMSRDGIQAEKRIEKF